MKRCPSPKTIAFLLLPLLFTVPAAAESSTWEGACEVRFAGKATLHDFTGTVTAEPFTAKITHPDDPSRANASARVVVEVDKMDTDNKKRDREMRKTLEAKRFPEIVVTADVTMEDLQPRQGANGPEPSVIPCTLTLMGKDHRFTASVSDWSRTADTVRFSVSFPLSLEDLGIEPPTAMGGLVRVKDRIQVSARITLEKR